MTLQDLFNGLSDNAQPVLFFFISIPLLTFALSLWTEKDQDAGPMKYLYSVLIYLVSIPGIFSLTLLFYVLIIERQSIQQLNVLTYFLPAFAMIVTFLIARRSVNLKSIPGFGSLTGLSMVLAATFISMLILQKTRIWVVFHGTVFHLLILFVVLFIIIKIGWDKFLKK